MVIAKVVGIVTIWIVTVLPVKATDQSDSAAPEKLMTGSV
jgi:hypothetical protein